MNSGATLHFTSAMVTQNWLSVSRNESTFFPILVLVSAIPCAYPNAKAKKEKKGNSAITLSAETRKKYER